MKKLIIHVLIGWLCGFPFICRGQIIAYNPENITFPWWSWNDPILDEVGKGTIDTAIFNIRVEGQMAKVTMEVWLRAIPDPERMTEDNDSLELRVSFEADEHFLFTDLDMRMHDSIRHGKIISKQNALNIWQNLVYEDPTFNPPPPCSGCDPGLLYIDNEIHYLRVFPSGSGLDECAFIRLEACVPIRTVNANTSTFEIPIGLLAKSAEPLHHLRFDLQTSGDYTSLTDNTSYANQWVGLDSNSYRLEAFYAEFSDSQLRFELENLVHETTTQSLFQDSLSTWAMHSWNMDAFEEFTSSDYLIVVDASKNDYPSAIGDAEFASLTLDAVSKITSMIDSGSRFNVLVRNQFFRHWQADFSLPTESAVNDALSFIKSNMGGTTDPMQVVQYVANFMKNKMGQVVFITSSYLYGSETSSEQFRLLAEQMPVPCRTDIVHLGQNRSTVHGNQTDFTFFESVSDNSSGYFLFGHVLSKDRPFIRPKIAYVKANNSISETESFLYFDESSGRAIFTQKNPTQIDVNQIYVHYTNGKLVSLSLDSAVQLASSDAVITMFGYAKYKFEKQANVLGTMPDRHFEAISTEFGFMNEYTALLVVEHDSQYNDTITDWFVFVPLNAEEILYEGFNGIRAYPNPITEEVVIETDAEEIVSISLFSLKGEIVLTQTCEPSISIRLRLGHLPAGYYLYKLETVDRKTHLGNLIKQ